MEFDEAVMEVYLRLAMHEEWEATGEYELMDEIGAIVREQGRSAGQ